MDHLSLSCENYEVKPYFYKLNLALSRVKFRERALTVKYCRLHFSSDKQFLKSAFVCPSCSKDSEGPQFYDQLSHWRTFSSYEYLRNKYKDLSDDFQLSQYYSDIIQLRASEIDQ